VSRISIAFTIGYAKISRMFMSAPERYTSMNLTRKMCGGSLEGAAIYYGRFLMYKKMLKRTKKLDTKEALERAARRLAEH